MIDLIIIALIIAYCIFLVVRKIKKSKDPDNCTGICAGCSGCGPSGSKLRDEYFANEHKKG